MGISVQTLWVLVFRGVNDLPEGSFRRNDPSLTNRIPNGSNGSTKTAACSGWEEPLGGTVLSLQACGFWFLVSAPKARLAARRAATHFCGSREGGLRCGRVRQAAAIPSGNAVAANMADESATQTASLNCIDLNELRAKRMSI